MAKRWIQSVDLHMDDVSGAVRVMLAPAQLVASCRVTLGATETLENLLADGEPATVIPDDLTMVGIIPDSALDEVYYNQGDEASDDTPKWPANGEIVGLNAEDAAALQLYTAEAITATVQLFV